ncbi:MAG: STAS domain-containing protein [Gammaproteobacteria bacterium]|nr:STAS domain-containing protein [Gammaproteobacteria bacterium]
MKYEITKNTSHTLLSLSGDIDLHSSSELRKQIISICKTKAPLQIDLEKVTYLDSSGVACFVEAYQLTKKNDSEFWLINISNPVMQVIKLARLDSVFPIR